MTSITKYVIRSCAVTFYVPRAILYLWFQHCIAGSDVNGIYPELKALTSRESNMKEEDAFQLGKAMCDGLQKALCSAETLRGAQLICLSIAFSAVGFLPGIICEAVAIIGAALCQGISIYNNAAKGLNVVSKMYDNYQAKPFYDMAKKAGLNTNVKPGLNLQTTGDMCGNIAKRMVQAFDPVDDKCQFYGVAKLQVWRNIVRSFLART
jgi:hypothetical protein